MGRKNKQEKSKIFHYNFFPKNRSGEKIISVYWFAILFIVAAGISYMVFAFYGAPYDVREFEANLLTDKITGCLSQSGFLEEHVFSENFKNDFAKNCKLNFATEDVFDWEGQGQYYAEVEIRNFNDGNLLIGAVEGNFNLKDFCGQEGKSFPVCLERKFYSLDKENNQYEIKILTVVRKTEKNVK